MPEYSSPGVYVEEVAANARSIVGTPTAITAFVGRARRGPVNQPVEVTSFGGFERRFGRLWVHSTLGFAVRDFFENGGDRAIVVRLHRSAAAARLSVDRLDLVAADPGAWGDGLRARVEHDANDSALFDLSVLDRESDTVEVFRGVSVQVGHPRSVDAVLEQESYLVRVDGALPVDRPAVSCAAETGADPFSPSTSTGVAAADRGSDGDTLTAAEYVDGRERSEGIHALAKANHFNILCIPPFDPATDVPPDVWAEAAALCEEHRAFLIVDAPGTWTSAALARAGLDAGVGTASGNAAIYFPRLRQTNPERNHAVEDFAACGAVAGVFARTDKTRGVWKAPAGGHATLVGVNEFAVELGDADNAMLGPMGLNCLRRMPALGRVIWGARTLQGAERVASEWKYVPVRRLALHIEESLRRGLEWVVFEPNDEPLWSQIRASVGAFLHALFRKGAFQGASPGEAYFVKCDRETTTVRDIDCGVVNILVGYAPLKPAEFVVLQIQQRAGRVDG